MEPFSAVVTTGIYCRSGCPARPNAHNVRPFAQAAAAEAAGYRACLRCRPYRSPQPLGWDGPEIVCRAVHLIVDGALDGESEADLGRRLGMSARQLRRLFAAHVGATPDQVARSRRTHFARRLLDDTELSITEVAFAAGFGSLRQFNRACQEVFRATPRELRGRRRATDRLVADGGLPLRLPYTGPLGWDALLGWFAARAVPGVEDVRDGTYRRTVVVDGDAGVIEMSPGEPGAVLLRAHLPHWEHLTHIVARARRVFALDAPVTDAVAHLAPDPVLGPLVTARPGLRVPGTWDAYETGIRAILGQQVSVAGATTAAGRLVARFGSPVPGLRPLGLSATFPAPEVLAAADPSDFAGLGLPGRRADAVRAFALAVASGSVRLDRSVPLERLIASLTAIRGIGPWTAHYVALRLGERDAFPAGDLGLRTAVGRRDTAASLERLAERWRPWRAYAATHLWLQTGPNQPSANQPSASHPRMCA